MPQQLKQAEKLAAIQSGAFDVVLTTYDTFRNDEASLQPLQWNCAVFDEVHKIKGRKAKMTAAANAIATPRRYGLTGTVMQNNFEELFTLLDFVRVRPVFTLLVLVAKLT